MYSWKQKIADKLSHLLSVSPSSTSPTFNQPQARPYSEGIKMISNQSNPILLDGMVKTSHGKINLLENYAECDREYEKRESPNQNGVDENYFSLRVTKCQNMRISDSREEFEDFGSARSTGGCEIFVDATDGHNFEKSMPNLTDDSLFISYDLYEFFQSSLPNIVKGCQWVLLYSTRKHGISLRTLIRRSADLPGPCLLITGDKQGAVFGGLLDCPLKPTVKRKYQGTNQSFVFTTIYGEPRLFRPTGANRYFYMCLNDLLALGGGGSFALCMDGDLLTGSSGASETFGNVCLAHNQEFELKNVELWGFTHSSQYLR